MCCAISRLCAVHLGTSIHVATENFYDEGLYAPRLDKREMLGKFSRRFNNASEGLFIIFILHCENSRKSGREVGKYSIRAKFRVFRVSFREQPRGLELNNFFNHPVTG